MASDYDVIVLGAGPAGEHCAGRLAEGGAKVAIVDRELVGGECSYWACIPSKTLLRSGEALADAREAPGAAEVVDERRMDTAAAFEWRDFQVNDYSDASQVQWLEDDGIDLIRGDGRLAGTGAVEVDGTIYTAEHVVVATGSEPRFPIPGLDELDGIWTNREATGLREVPQRMLVLGDGPVGVEMGQAVSRMGASVVIVGRADRVLPREPAPLGKALGQVLEAEGIELRLENPATAARRDGDGYVLELEDGSELRGDKLLVASGRIPRTGIGLETVGIDAGDKGIPVDERMCAGERLWAIGDVTGIWPFTYIGKYQGRVVASNILGKPAKASYDAVPRVVFTDPQVASVGEAQGKLTSTIQLEGVARTSTYTRAYDKKPGFVTLVSDGERLTGAHALGPEAGEWLQQVTLAIRARVPLDVLLDTIQPFPTFSEALLFALLELGSQVE